MAVNMRIETITPEQAKNYLKHNKANRNINEVRVSSYARDMKNGQWQLNGESIKFNASGDLIDGQHRLCAIVRSGVPVMICVVTGLESSISEVDRGKPRSTKDTLTIDGYDKNILQAHIVGGVRMFTCYRLGISLTNYGGITDSEVKETYDFLMPEIKKIASFNYRAGAGVSRKASVVCAMLMALKCGVSYETIEEFSNVLNMGRYTSDRQLPAMVLRDDFLQDKFRKNGKIKSYEHLYGIEKAIYDFDKGVTRKKTYVTIDTPIYSCSQLIKKDKEEE